MRFLFRDCRENGKRFCGYQAGNIIVINLMKRQDILNTYIHETLHYRHPDWPHAKVYRETAKIMRKLNLKQRLRFYRQIFGRR